jgi:predicted GNAT family N-acyltransferase
MVFSGSAAPRTQGLETVEVRELSSEEMIRAERELLTRYHHQNVDRTKDRFFAAFSGKRIIGVARCTRHQSNLEVGAVYVLDEFRHRGFARSIMRLLIEACGRNETLYTRARAGLVEFYRGFGFYPIGENDLPESIRDHTASEKWEGRETCPMKRDPSPVSNKEGTS